MKGKYYLVPFFFSLIYCFTITNTFASNYQYVETISIEDSIMDISSDGSNLLMWQNGAPKDKILISDLAGNTIQSFETLGAYTCGLTYNASRNKILFTGGNDYTGDIYEMDPSNGSITGPVANAGFSQPNLAYDGANILASGPASGSNGVSTIIVNKFDANSYAFLGNIMIVINTGIDTGDISRSIVEWHSGYLYGALSISRLRRIYEYDSIGNFMDEIPILEIGDRAIGDIAFIQGDLFVRNYSISEIYRYTPVPEDTIAPIMEITSPTSNLLYSISQATVNLGGEASDNVGITGVTWVNDRGGSGNCTGTTSWSCSGIAILVGQNVITVTASDEAGNPGTDTLTVTYTPPVEAPDFLVDSISITPTFLLPNSTFNATVTIKNQGVGSADAGFLDIWKNRDVTAGCGTSGDIRVSVGTLAAGETKTFSFFNLSNGAEGNRTFRAFVDSTCSASESNEGNNQRTSPYQVKAGCSYSLTPPIWAFGASGGIGAFFVETREDCSWVPDSDSDWLMCQEGRVGPGILYYSVVPNDAGTARVGNISVQGQNFTILQAKSDFVDVDSDYWANSWIYAVYASELASGYGNGYFGPEDYVTREQMAVFIIRALNEVPDDGYCGLTNPFSDVGFDRWSCKYIKKLSELGITTGYGDGRFGPEDVVTREQMAVFIVKALAAVPLDGYCEGTDPFTDVPFNRWSCKYVKKLAELEITTGYGDGRFGPTDYVTRAQMAVFLSRGFLGM